MLTLRTAIDGTSLSLIFVHPHDFAVVVFIFRSAISLLAFRQFFFVCLLVFAFAFSFGSTTDAVVSLSLSSYFVGL